MKIAYCAAAILTASVLMTGCATYGELEKDYGKSYTVSKYGQILNPAASKNLKPVPGLPGEVVDPIMQKYTASFEKNGNANQGQKNLFVPLVNKAGNQP